MNNIKKLIFKTQTESITPPTTYSWDVSVGTEICNLGYVDIGGTITTATIYTSVNKDDWDVGTVVYDDIALTIPTSIIFFRSTTGGTIGTRYVSLMSGVVTENVPPMTPC